MNSAWRRFEPLRARWRALWDGRAAAGTNGGSDGTGGGRRAFWIAYGLIVAGVVTVCTVNSLSLSHEFARSGRPAPVWQPFLLEGTSGAMFIALAPLVHALQRRWPLRRDRLGASLAVLVLALPVFSAAHIVGMAALRLLLFGLVGQRYGFDWTMEEFIYEFRKDAATYVAFVGAFHVIGRLVELERALADRRAAALPGGVAPGLLALRDGARTRHVAVSDILWVASAGNYVEIALADDRKLLIRGTLQGFEKVLSSHGFARVHRARIVNMARVTTLDGKDSGDFVLSLDDGSQLGGSRRYRGHLAPLLGRSPPATGCPT